MEIKSKPPKNRPLRVAVEPAQYETLKALAEGTDLSVAEVVRQLLTEALKGVQRNPNP